MTSLVLLYAETPLHAGAGTRVSYVDLPVQRERITNYPIIQASSLKGVLRWEAFQAAENSRSGWDFKKVAVIFGPGEDLKKNEVDEDVKNLDASEFAGAIALTDARILLFPVRSLRGVFAWLTCPLVLRRFMRDLQLTGWPAQGFPSVEEMEKLTDLTPGDNEIVVSAGSRLVVETLNSVVLEDFQLTVKEENGTLKKLSSALAIQYQNQNPITQDLPGRIAMVSDNTFQEFVEMTTEVISRIRIDQVTGTVAEGALWTEELVPSESLFWTVVKVDKPLNGKAKEWNLTDADALREAVKNLTDGQVLQFGGDETLGRGWLRLCWVKAS